MNGGNIMKKILTLMFVCVLLFGIIPIKSYDSEGMQFYDIQEITTSFDLTKGSQKIVTKDEYNNEVIISVFTVNSTTLSIPRKYETATLSARAEYYFEASLVYGGGLTNGWLRADIKDFNITVSFK